MSASTLLRPTSPSSDGSSDGADGWREVWARLRPLLSQGLLALAASWVALIAWSGMVAEPRRYLTATLLIGAAMALTGILVRAVRLPAYLAPVAQLLVGLLGLDVLAARGEALFGVVPTLASAQQTYAVILNGAASLNLYSSPVQVNPLSTATMLTACGLGVILVVDLLASTLRQAPLAALPLLAALSVPVSILREGLALPVFVVTALLFLRLLAADHLASLARWAPRAGRARAPRASLSTFWAVSVAAVVAALTLTPLVPVSDLLQRNQGGSGGAGTGAGVEMTTLNPFIRLRRDLVEKTHTSLVYATTDASATGYLRTTVLDEFTKDEWRPSPRDLPRDNDANGAFPDAPGVAAGASGTTSTWKLSLDRSFLTSWLPLPYTVTELEVGRGWRYDSRTLDVAYVSSGSAETPLNYSLKAFTPEFSPARLRGAVRASQSIRTTMTQLPSNFPEVIRQQAEKVTENADTDFDKAVALQDWFRTDGGFTYSLEQRPGSGMELLSNFVTADRVGYCEQFASAMAAMGRSLGIPSRVVVGFLDGSTLPDGRILYTSDERHAWPEMYFAGSGWVRFEPTPSQRAGTTPDYTREQAAALPTDAASPTPTEAPSTSPDDALDQDVDQGGSGLSVPWRPVGGALAVLLLALAPAALRRWQRHRRLGGADPVHLVEGAWSELGATALDLGLDWPEHRSPREQAARVTAQVGAEAESLASLESLLLEVERGRYAPAGDTSTLSTVRPETRTRTMATVDSWRQAMTASVKNPWRARWWPASLLRRRTRD